MLAPAPAAEPEPQPKVQTGKNYLPFLSSFPAQLNDRVGVFIDFFQKRANPFFTRSLARSSAYEGMMKQILREKNLPEELFYLALIESGFDPKAFSPAKAGGIWQFISGTAKRFGLKVNPWVDERRDPEKATYAAAAYLKNLFEMFNSWDLAAAGYNAGEGKVLKAMKKTQKQEYWELAQSRYLRRETKEYVPMFLAAVAIAQDPQKYGFIDISYHPPLVYEKMLVPPATSLASVARAAQIDLAELQGLNPSLRKGMTPPEAPGFELKLPPGKRALVEKNIDQLRPAAVKQSKKHRVRSGETLARVAKLHNVSVNDLCSANNLGPKSRLKPGTRLVLPD
jgi:membrane-bound lytic murein transglycosylase D